MADSTPIEKLESLNAVNIQNAGQLLLAAIMTPVITGFERSAAFIQAMFNLPITVVQTFTEELGLFIVALIGGAAGVVEQSFLAAELGFTQGNVWATLGPLAPAIGTASVLGVALVSAYYYRMKATADSPLGLFSATDFPLIGADEEE